MSEDASQNSQGPSTGPQGLSAGPQGLSAGPRRRTSLRIVIGILLAAGMFYGWSAMGRQKGLKQAEAVQAITDAGGRIYLDYQWLNGKVHRDGQPQQAAWLRNMFGPEAFDRAVALDMRAVTRTDEVIPWLTLLPYLVDLNAAGTALDDAAMSTVGRLAGLKQLDLSGTQVSDNGVAQLGRLTQVTSLSLASTDVSDSCVEVLATMKRLKQLELQSTGVSESGLTRLRQALPKCQIRSQ